MLKVAKQTERQRSGRATTYLGATIARDVEALAAALNLSFSATVRRLLKPAIALEQQLLGASKEHQ